MFADEIVGLELSHRDALARFLGRGRDYSAIYDWKYFDPEFNCGRLRGVCAFKEGQMIGFLGLIPVELRCGERAAEDNWLCDWVIADPVGNKGLGGELARFALAQVGRMIAYGGSPVAKQRWPRHAVTYDVSAGITAKLFLRLGGYLSVLERRIPAVRWLRAVRAMPTSFTRPLAFDVTQGVSSRMAIDHQTSDQWRPYYSIADLRWRLERCPGIVSWTLSPERSAGNVLVWYREDNPRSWKGSLFTVEGSDDEARCLRAAAAFTRAQGGEILTFHCSRLDRHRQRSLKRAGFLFGRNRNPIHFMNLDKAGAPASLAGLSCLDTDFTYRFG